jgi:hypothetical protein
MALVRHRVRALVRGRTQTPAGYRDSRGRKRPVAAR